MIEVRFHGRGGQGAVVASEILATALFKEGKFVQAFPAFGVERRGAPVMAFLRFDSLPIRRRCQIYEPDHVVVLDPTLLLAIDVTTGLKPNGSILINSDSPPQSFTPLQKFLVATVPAAEIAVAHKLGTRTNPIVNTAILGAFARVTGFVSLEAITESIAEKIPTRHQERNQAAAREAYERVTIATLQHHSPFDGEGQGERSSREKRSRKRGLPRKERAMKTPIVFTSEQEMPPMAVSLADMGHNRTGSWRYLRPIYSEKLAPCTGACPAGNDIPRIMSLVAEGRHVAAWRLLRATSPLPGVCGRVCYHPCESACNRKDFDEALSVAAIERFLADECFDLEDEIPSRARRAERVAVVGSGPAGLTCAYFLAKDGYSVTVFEAESEPGGMLRVGIPQYRLPRAVLDREIESIARWGVEFTVNTRIGRDIDLEKLWEQHEAVFIATGAHRSRPLGIPGEELALTGLEFLKRVNAGDSVQIGKRVLVIGGGNTAMDAARTALRLGARPLVVYRRTRGEMPAISEEIAEAEHEGIQFEFLAAPQTIRRLHGQLEVQFIRMQLGEPDQSGRRRPVPIPGSEFVMRADSILKAVGEEPELSFLSDSVETSEGIVISHAQGLLERAGIFIGGDAQTGPSTVVQAIGAGREAARAIQSFLRGGRKPKAVKLEEARRVNFSYFAHAPRVPTEHLPVSERITSFSESKQPISAELARAEAKRCFSCGVCNYCDNCWVFCPDAAIARVNGTYEVNYDFCKGCGVCAEECPRNVISLMEEEL